MAKNIKFVLNRKAFQQQVLMGDATAAMLEVIATAAAPSGTRVETSVSSNARNSGRARARIIDDSPRAMSREADTGHLSRALGGG